MSEESEPAVINTGPLIALNACQQVDLLPFLHKPVIVPQEVIDELERGRDIDHIEVVIPQWLDIRSLSHPLSPLLLAHLDEGEAAVIALALESGIRRIIMDERRGRMVGRTMGLEVTGSVGILLRAKRAGHLSALRPCLEAMVDKGVWLSERLMEFALREGGEF